MASKESIVVEELFPEVNKIGDMELRRKVVTVWMKLWEMSSFERIQDVPFNAHFEKDKTSLVSHTRGVVSNAMNIADAMRRLHHIEVSNDLLLALSLLHDASKMVEYEKHGDKIVDSELGRRFPHAFFSTKIGIDVGLPTELSSLIIGHNPYIGKPPHTPEAVILHYSDMVEADMHRLLAGETLHLDRQHARLI